MSIWNRLRLFAHGLFNFHRTFVYRTREGRVICAGCADCTFRVIKEGTP